jgi:hypothetical protein
VTNKNKPNGGITVPGGGQPVVRPSGAQRPFARNSTQLGRQGGNVGIKLVLLPSDGEVPVKKGKDESIPPQFFIL